MPLTCKLCMSTKDKNDNSATLKMPRPGQSTEFISRQSALFILRQGVVRVCCKTPDTKAIHVHQELPCTALTQRKVVGKEMCSYISKPHQSNTLPSQCCHSARGKGLHQLKKEKKKVRKRLKRGK